MMMAEMRACVHHCSLFSHWLNPATYLFSTLVFRPHLWILHEEPVTLGSRLGYTGGSHASSVPPAAKSQTITGAPYMQNLRTNMGGRLYHARRCAVPDI